MASLGNAPIDRADWKPIAKTVEDRLYGRAALLARDLSNDQARWVDRIVRVAGMVFDQFGFELAHKVFEGSLNDSKSLLRMIKELNAVAADGKEKPLIVMDAGVATRKNLDLLRRHGFSYLVNDTRRQRKRYIKMFREQTGFQVVPGREGK